MDCDYLKDEVKLHLSDINDKQLDNRVDDEELIVLKLQSQKDETNKKELELRDSYRQRQYKESHEAKPGKEPDHTIPISVFKTVLKQNTHRLGQRHLSDLKQTVNQDWNFRMVRKETNRQWGVDILKLNTAYRKGEPVELNNRERDYLIRVFNHCNNNIEAFSAQVSKSLANYFDFFSNTIPYCRQSTRNW